MRGSATLTWPGRKAAAFLVRPQTPYDGEGSSLELLVRDAPGRHDVYSLKDPPREPHGSRVARR